MEAKAKATNLPISRRKLALVAALVRGRSVKDALVILEYTPKKAARLISKVVLSAKSNALSKNLLEDSLVIKEIRVGLGQSLKRYRPQAFGRAAPYKKHRAHLSVSLSGQAKPAKPKANQKKASKKKTGATLATQTAARRRSAEKAKEKK